MSAWQEVGASERTQISRQKYTEISNNICSFLSNPPTFTLTREVRVRTNRVFKWVNRFLLVGRTEKKKLQSARQDEFEMTIDRVYLQADQLIILDLD